MHYINDTNAELCSSNMESMFIIFYYVFFCFPWLFLLKFCYYNYSIFKLKKTCKKFLEMAFTLMPSCILVGKFSQKLVMKNESPSFNRAKNYFVLSDRLHKFSRPWKSCNGFQITILFYILTNYNLLFTMLKLNAETTRKIYAS